MALADTLKKIYGTSETGAAVPTPPLDYVPSMKDRVVDNLPLVPEQCRKNDEIK